MLAWSWSLKQQRKLKDIFWHRKAHVRIYKQVLLFFFHTPWFFLKLKISEPLGRISAWPPANVCRHTATCLDLSVYQQMKEPNNHNCTAESFSCSPGTHPWTPQSKTNSLFSFCFCFDWIIYSWDWWNGLSYAFLFPSFISLSLLPTTCSASCLTGIQCNSFLLPSSSLYCITFNLQFYCFPLSFLLTSSFFSHCLTQSFHIY